MTGPATCRVVEVDGAPVRVRGQHPMTPDAQEALAAVVRAAREHFAAAPRCGCGHLEQHHTAGRCRVRMPVPCECQQVAL